MSQFMRHGMNAMMKDGSQFMEDPVIKNIQACKELCKLTRTSMGPMGLNKMVVNSLNKLIVTHDTATIMRELEVEHPAAKLLVMAAKAQEEEIGEGTNFVISFAGELLANAENLIRMGLHTSDIIEGYMQSGAKALELLEKKIPTETVGDLLKAETVVPAIRTAIAAKMFGYEDHLAPLVAEACSAVCPVNVKSFSVDNVRVCKLDGGSVNDTALIHGHVVSRAPEGTIKHAKNAKVALFSTAIDIPSTETKGTALIETAEQLLDYSKREEEIMEQIIANIAKAGVKVIASNSTYGDLALHFVERYGMMALKVPSKWEMKRLASAVNARVLAKLDVPTPEELGHIDLADVLEMGGKFVTVFKQEKDDSKVSTILVRGGTQNVMDDVERAIDDAVNVFKALTKDRRVVAGAGAVEMELQKELLAIADTTPGMEQYAMRKYANSFEVIARTIAESSGHNGTNVVTKLEAEHAKGNSWAGVDCDSGEAQDTKKAGIVDPLLVKFWGLKLATDAAITVLSVDMMIIAKQAGGPKPRGQGARDDE